MPGVLTHDPRGNLPQRAAALSRPRSRLGTTAVSLTIVASVFDAGLAWARPLERGPVLELAARTVPLGPIDALENEGVIYVRTRRALGRDLVEEVARSGLRLLGMADGTTYAFELAAPGAKDALRTLPELVGVAEAEPADKLDPTLASAAWDGTCPHEMKEILRRGASAPVRGFEGSPEQVGLTLVFWANATAAEVRGLIGAPDGFRLPSASDGRLGPESVVFLPPDVAQWLDLDALLESPAVASLGLDLPKVELNDGSRALARSDVLVEAPFTLDGAGVLVGHWDGGSVEADHPDLTGRVTNLTSSGVSLHATHTAGTILGSGAGRPSARGHAPAARMVALSFNGNPTAERREVKHLYYHHHDNHSWGVNPDVVSNFGTYNQVALEFDIDARDLLLLPVKAAGNEGGSGEVVVDQIRFDSLSPDSTSKNALVVGACDVEGRLAGFSSRGPTEDGRVKPDVVAVGVGVVSTVPGASYSAAQGTSMATPGASGMLALLAELFERGSQGRRLHPDVARGLLIHTARDAYHPGPDYAFGWGIADAGAAGALLARDIESGGLHLVRGAVREGEQVERAFEVEAGAQSLKVTLSWLDAFLQAPATRRLLNDIDLILVAPDGAIHRPWVLDPARPTGPATRAVNAVDNIEQVVVHNPLAGRWIARVEGTSIRDPDLFVQGFVLVSDRPFERSIIRVPGTPSTRLVPDGEGALEVPFEVSSRATVGSLRVFLDLQHEARGHLRIELVHPDGTTATLETEDTSTRRDIYAIYPDLRSYDEDVIAFFGKPAGGTWTLRIQDLTLGETGELRHAELEIDLDAPVNAPPVAVISGPASAPAGTRVTLSGTSSTDPDGDALRFEWRPLAGQLATLDGDRAPEASFVMPAGAEDLVVEVELLVSDAFGGRATATHRVRLDAANESPVARLAAPEEAVTGEMVELDASGSTDPEGGELTFLWAQTEGPAVLPTERGDRWRFVIPSAPAGARLGFSVRVVDPDGAEDEARAEIRVRAAGGGAISPPAWAPGAAPAAPAAEPPSELEGTVEGSSGCRGTSGSASPLGLLLASLFVVRGRRRAGAASRARP